MSDKDVFIIGFSLVTPAMAPDTQKPKVTAGHLNTMAMILTAPAFPQQPRAGALLATVPNAVRIQPGEAAGAPLPERPHTSVNTGMI